MKQTFQQMVINELLRDRTPRTCFEIEAAVTRNTGFTSAPHRTSSTLNAISKKPQFSVVIGRGPGKNTYYLSDEPKDIVAPEKPETAPNPVVNISQMFEQLLWSARQGRGQA